MSLRAALVVFLAVAALVPAVPVFAGSKGCPPGLAKKAQPCVPPGQAKKHAGHIGRGDRVTDYPYHLIRYPDRYGLDPLRPGERYYVVNGQILRVSEETYEVLDVIRAISALLD
ncbi:MAG: excinuclease ABC subunit A [Rhodobacteraceae bacterium]|nr:excinuclease ABC subunit A [Paracoccaceae bacterium]